MSYKVIEKHKNKGVQIVVKNENYKVDLGIKKLDIVLA